MSNKKSSIEERIASFKKWIQDPVNKLREMEGNDGGFVILLISLVLYESHLKYIWIDCDEKWRDKENGLLKGEAIHEKIAEDFGINSEEAKIFWIVMRNGSAHTGMPEITDKSPNYQYKISEKFEEALGVSNNIIKINISRFYEKVIELCNPSENELKIKAQWPYVWQRNKENTNNNESNSQKEDEASGTQSLSPITGSHDPRSLTGSHDPRSLTGSYDPRSLTGSYDTGSLTEESGETGSYDSRTSPE
ncbi:MAG: hypothetical protein PHO36_16280 [Parabacteroides sp.]|nr:hypothetical protein [Parabacteroides sp.]